MKNIRFWLCFSFLMILFTLPVQGKNQLQLEKVEVTTDLENVDINETIYLHFSNNVVNVSVRENNLQCFSLVDEDGKEVPFTVFMGDDQVDRDIKRIVEIRPEVSWAPGTKYTITISGSMMAKNETSLMEPVNVEFITTGNKPSSGILLLSIALVSLIIVIIGGVLFVRRKK